MRHKENILNVLKAAIFILIFLFLLRSVTYIIRTNGDVKDRFAGFYAEKENSIDVIFIGSSPVHPYYVFPKFYGEYGIVSYPLSSYQQRPKAAPYLIEEANKTQQPKVWVFEMRQYLAEESVMTENLAHTRSLTDNLKYSWNRIELINELVDNPEERYTYYFDIFKYHSNWKTMILPSQLACFRYEVNDPWKGFLYMDEIEGSVYYDVTGITDTMPIPGDKEETLRNLLQMLDENDMEAVFIVSPYLINDEMQMKYNYIADIIDEYEYPFINFNNYISEIGIDFATDYYDGGNHANIYGAEKCTDFLAKYLLENYTLPDHRGEEDYKSWDESYELWLSEKEKSQQN